MRKASIFIAVIIMFVTVITSCSKSGSDNNTTSCDGVTNKSFVTDVNPVIQSFCNQAGCHNPGSTNGPGALTNYAEVFNARTRIRGQIQAGLMPQNATLSAAQKNSIICWIDSGAPNN